MSIPSVIILLSLVLAVVFAVGVGLGIWCRVFIDIDPGDPTGPWWHRVRDSEQPKNVPVRMYDFISFDDGGQWYQKVPNKPSRIAPQVWERFGYVAHANRTEGEAPSW